MCVVQHSSTENKRKTNKKANSLENTQARAHKQLDLSIAANKQVRFFFTHRNSGTNIGTGN